MDIESFVRAVERVRKHHIDAPQSAITYDKLQDIIREAAKLEKRKARKAEPSTWDTHENVDRMGGSFSASEIENATAWR